MRKEDFAEAIGDINEKYIVEARAERKAKKPVWLKWGAMAACLCLVVAGLALPMLNKTPVPSFYVNQIAMVITSAPPYFDPENHYTESRNDAGIAEYLGVDLSDIGDQYKYIGNENHTLTFRNDGTLVDDVVGFAYSSADGESTVSITVSKLKMPSGDICFPFEEERSTRMTSKNGEIDVVFYADAGGINPTEKQDRVTASFKLGDVYYRVTVMNCFAQEAYQVVSDILMK